MAAPVAQPVSKSAKKKAAKGIERTESPAPSVASGPADKTDGQDNGSESPYIKELQKNIRNINKKLANASKTDTVINQNSDKTLDELVAAKILNADQKAQALKKPALQTQLAQAEEQLVQYQKLDQQYKTQSVADKAEWEKSVGTLREDAVKEAKAGFEKTQSDNLLILSQFLRLAACRRAEAEDPDSDESNAIEGVLSAIYRGDETAVSSMLKLVQGSSEPVTSIAEEPLATTYDAVRSLAQEYKSSYYPDSTEAPEASTTEAVSDPTLVHASATEINAGDVAQLNGQSAGEPSNGLANADVKDEAANSVAESHWDTGRDMSLSQEWVDVKVPRDPAETDTGLQATPAANTNTQSWADDHVEPAPQPTPAVPEGDGFHQVQRNRGRSDRESSGWRGGRGRGEHRGRGGHRGEGRGRGRGSRGGPSSGRGPRRAEES